MVNFNGIYLVDSGNYCETLRRVAEKLNCAGAIKKFSAGKSAADAELNNLTEEFRGIEFRGLSGKRLWLAVKKFYDARCPFTQYSFFFDTVTKSVDSVLASVFSAARFPDSKRHLAYVPASDTIEFVYLSEKSRFLKKHSREIKRNCAQFGDCSLGFTEDLESLMGEFADFCFVDFGMPLETKEQFLQKILGRAPLCGKTNGMRYVSEERFAQADLTLDIVEQEIKALEEMKAEKSAMVNELLPECADRGIDSEFVSCLFGFAGNLASWESEARHTWTRLHRAVKPLIAEIGARAAEKGLLGAKEEIFQKEIKEIIAIAEALSGQD